MACAKILHLFINYDFNFEIMQDFLGSAIDLVEWAMKSLLHDLDGIL